MSTAKSTPKDAQVMSAILKDMGIIEHEPRVINQMLEFTYRYVTTILDDARLFSSHCKKKSLDTDDVRLAVQLQMDKSFTTPPPRDLLLEIARQKNNIPLPLIKANAGPRLPPDRYSLTACNYRLKPSKKPRTQVRGSGGHNLNISSSPSVPKLSAAVNLNSKTGSTLSVITKNMTSPTVTIVSRPASMPGITKTVPTPLIKLSQGGPAVVSMASSISSSSSVTTPSSTPQASANVSSSMPTDLKAPGTPMDTSTGVKTGVKREHEDDPDDYDAN